MSDGEISRIYRRLMMAVGRGRVKVVDDSGLVQSVQVQLGADEVRDSTPRLIEYGFTSNPHPGADAVVLFLGGDRSTGVIIATGDNRYRLSVSQGEVSLYDDLGQHVWLKRTGVVIDAPLGLTINGNVTIVGNQTATGSITAGFGTGDAVGLQTHKHGTGTAATGTVAPTAGT